MKRITTEEPAASTPEYYEERPVEVGDNVLENQNITSDEVAETEVGSADHDQSFDKETYEVKSIEIPSRLAYEMAICLDKAQFCLARGYGKSLDLIENHAKEAMRHLEEIKKVVHEWRSDTVSMEEFTETIDQVFFTLENLNKKILDCQEESLCNIIDTLLNETKALAIPIATYEESRQRRLSADDITHLAPYQCNRKLRSYFFGTCLVLFCAAGVFFEYLVPTEMLNMLYSGNATDLCYLSFLQFKTF